MKQTLLIILFGSLISVVSAQSNNDPNSNQENPSQVIDNGFFKYEVTGDKLKDEENYGKAKDAFVEKYPEKYAEMVEKYAQEAQLDLNAKENESMDTGVRTVPE